MKVIVVFEEPHDFIGIVGKVDHIVNFLIDHNRLYDFTGIWINNYECRTVREVYGYEWITVLSRKSLSELQEIFDDQFYFDEIEVYE